jgi:hypothetical protein
MNSFTIRNDSWIVSGTLSYLIRWVNGNAFSCPICGATYCAGHYEENQPFFVLVRVQTESEAIEAAVDRVFCRICEWTDVVDPNSWDFSYYEDQLYCHTLNISALLDWELAKHPKRVRGK